LQRFSYTCERSPLVPRWTTHCYTGDNGLRTIVVVEDEQASREGLLVLLARAGYRTIGAGTLKEARHILEEITPDLLIVDIRLSGDNGLQLLAMARNPIPAIVITAFDDRTLAAEARNFGAEFMLKPVSPAALLAAIQRKVPATSDQPAGPSRRWPRRRVSGDIAALVGDSPARIVDVGYGGVRFEVQQSGTDLALPEWVRLTVPGNASIDLHVVWNRRSGDTWQCGAAVNDEYRPAWEQLVDTLS
jgi:CheY-like chemotaxis protein